MGRASQRRSETVAARVGSLSLGLEAALREAVATAEAELAAAQHALKGRCQRFSVKNKNKKTSWNIQK